MSGNKSKHAGESCHKHGSSKRSDSPNKKHKDVKNIVLDYLEKYKKELKDEKRTTFKTMSFPLSELKQTPVALEVMGKDVEGSKDSPETQNQREQVTSVVQQLLDSVKTDGERILVVNVNTPAVDLSKNFDAEQLHYIKNDIFTSIKQQLGADFKEDVEEQWGTAFKAMMDIVQAQKQKPS